MWSRMPWKPLVGPSLARNQAPVSRRCIASLIACVVQVTKAYVDSRPHLIVLACTERQCRALTTGKGVVTLHLPNRYQYRYFRLSKQRIVFRARFVRKCCSWHILNPRVQSTS